MKAGTERSEKHVERSRRSTLALAVGTLAEVVGGILSGDHTDLEDQIIAAGFDSGDGPPLEESPNPNTVDVGDAAGNDLAGDVLGVGGEVVVRREGDLAVVAEVDGEVAGGGVDGVAEDVGGEEANGEDVVGELRVGG